MKMIYLGFSTGLAENWMLISPPVKPGNWKQETFDAKYAELCATKKEKLMSTPNLVATQLTEVWLKQPGVAAVNIGVGETATQAIAECIPATETLRIVGVDTLRNLRQLAWNISKSPAWAIGLDPRVEIINLYTSTGGKQAGVTLTEWYAGQGYTGIPDTAMAECEAVTRIAEDFGI